jgi:hypothetical protein
MKAAGHFAHDMDNILEQQVQADLIKKRLDNAVTFESSAS